MYLYMPGFRNITEHPHSPFQGSFSILGTAGRPDRSFIFLAFGYMLPSADNRILIDPMRLDAWGIPVAHIDCRHSANERALIPDMVETLRYIAAAAGRRVKSGFADTTGVIRRAHGDDLRSSVVNRFNQSRDVPNVFVTDGACFVFSGHQSHTLTMMAVTARACESIATRHRAGTE